MAHLSPGCRALSIMLTGALVGSLLGCASNDKRQLADETAPVEQHVLLPRGFQPLADQSIPDDEQDHYGGWPRYIVSERDKMVMAYVPSQVIRLGGGTGLDEVPAREVVVNHFYMDIHEVTNGQFAGFSGSGKEGSFRRYYVVGQNEDHPVRNVSWNSAASYAKWANKWLPTEAQWEAAARGDDQRIFPWGNDSTSETTRYLCNASTSRSDYDGYEYTAPVMNYAAGVSPFGIFNLAGNVWEWCADNYDPGRYAYPSVEDPATGLDRGAKEFGDTYYPNPRDKDIREARVGPLRGSERVIRGGSFADSIERCRVDAREAARPGATFSNVGFRTVLVLPSE